MLYGTLLVLDIHLVALKCMRGMFLQFFCDILYERLQSSKASGEKDRLRNRYGNPHSALEYMCLHTHSILSTPKAANSMGIA
jgi:hypothetical protein